MDGDTERQKAEKKAYRLLALRGHSEKELREKLRQGRVPESLITGVIEKCRDSGYLDDGNFARQRARELAVNRLFGDRRIAVDLREKGIPETLSRQAITEVRREIGEEEAIETILRKKGRGRAVMEMDGREKARLARSLSGKGFPTGLIFRKLKGKREDGFHDDDGE